MKVLVTGGNGFLGSWICALLSSSQHIETIAVGRSAEGSETDRLSQARVDLSEELEVKRAFMAFTPDVVVHAAALSDPTSCEEQPAESRKANVDASLYMAAVCKQSSVPLIFTSTDWVFDGRRGGYVEDDDLNPINLYGCHKAEAEKSIRAIYPMTTIVRLPWMFGVGLTKKSAFTSTLEKLSSGESVLGFVDEFRSPVSYAVAAAGIVNLFNCRPGQTFHLGGREVVSRYEFLLALARGSLADAEQVIGRRQADVTFSARRPADVSLRSQKAYSFGYQVPSLSEMIQLELARGASDG